MKGIIYALLCCLFFINAYSQKVEENYLKDEIILQFKTGSTLVYKNCLVQQKFNDPELNALNRKYGAKSIQMIGNKKTQNTYVLKFKESQNILSLVDEYRKTNLFKYVEPNFIGRANGKMETIPNDTYFFRQYGLHNDGTFPSTPSVEDADIDMNLAWDIEQGDSSIIVAVLDAGIRFDHPEFSGRIWTNKDEMTNGMDDDTNGYLDDIRGWDFVNNDNDPTDDHGHGINVAGIIGANGNNNLGYAGVDWNCKLMTCKVLNQIGAGANSFMIDAIHYAVDNGAKVINMSVSSTEFSNIYEEATEYAHDNGVIIVAAMGNANNQTTLYPAGFQHTIAVGSTSSNDERSVPFHWGGGSCYGNHIDVVAPGNFTYGLYHLDNNWYSSYWSGTSQSTPLVSGLCALLLAQNSSRTPDVIREVIRSTAEDQVGKTSEDVAGFDIYHGYGRINAHQALLHPTSVKTIDASAQSKWVYPNPTKRFLNVTTNNEDKHLTVMNALGKEVLQQEVNSNPSRIDLVNLPRGVYFVRITSKNEKKVTKKFVIQ